MQFLSAGKCPLREKTHAGDAGLQPGRGSLAIAFGLVDRLHDQAYALLFLKGQRACGLQNTVAVNGLDPFGHSMLLNQSRTSRTSMQQCLQSSPAASRAPIAVEHIAANLRLQSRYWRLIVHSRTG